MYDDISPVRKINTQHYCTSENTRKVRTSNKECGCVGVCESVMEITGIRASIDSI